MSIGKATQASTSAPELAGLTLGFVPLLDAALLIIAREGGFFSAQGLDVSLSRENAWSTLRDKVAAGLLDGAHMLAPMPLAMSLGLSRAPCETLAAMVLGRQGNTLVLSQRLANALDVRSDLPRPARLRLGPARLPDPGSGQASAGHGLPLLLPAPVAP